MCPVLMHCYEPCYCVLWRCFTLRRRDNSILMCLHRIFESSSLAIPYTRIQWECVSYCRIGTLRRHALCVRSLWYINTLYNWRHWPSIIIVDKSLRVKIKWRWARILTRLKLLQFLYINFQSNLLRRFLEWKVLHKYMSERLPTRNIFWIPHYQALF